MSLLAGAHIVPFRSAARRCHRCRLGARVNSVKGAQAHSKEEAVKSMQSYKAGLSQAQANHEDMLLKAQRAPGEGVRASAAAVEGEPAAPTGLQELTKDDYDSFLRDAGDKLVIVDFYTDWCGPCKMILPQLVEMAEELKDRARIVKFNCNKYNKDLGISLGIKVAPTFLLYKHGEQVAMMTGAKVDNLRELIQKHC